MEETKNRKQDILNTIFAVLLFGGLWGIVEATIGSFLHLSFIHNTRLIFLSSTTVLVPIAYYLMGGCYKRTGKARSVIYMGILASIIKVIGALIFASNLEPALYMLMEALAMAGALLVIRPKKVVSYEGLATFILASTVYLLATTFYRIGSGTQITGQIVLENIEKYVFKYNCVAILYAFAFGAILYGFIKLAEAKEWKFEKVRKIIYHPAFAGSMAAVALAVTLILH